MEGGIAKQQADLAIARERSAVARGQFKYLKNLEKAGGKGGIGGGSGGGDDGGGEYDASECPICADKVGGKGGETPVMLPCGHVICQTCTEKLLTRGRRCPTCRYVNSRARVWYKTLAHVRRKASTRKASTRTRGFVYTAQKLPIAANRTLNHRCRNSISIESTLNHRCGNSISIESTMNHRCGNLVQAWSRPRNPKPRCRGAFAEADLAYVFEAEDSTGEGSAALVKGSFSTKVASLVRGVMRLPADEKCIIFSEWDDMLELISRALDENSIAHQRCKGGKAVSKGVASFRADPGTPEP